MASKINLDKLRITVSNIAQAKVQEGLEKACMIVESAAKKNCPKDMGILANSITYDIEDNVGYIYSPLQYAVWVELGTGLFAAEGNGRQTPWAYFYTGKKLSSAELDYIAKYGYQTFQGKSGV